ncbi:MAG: hypothetical protein LBG80_00760 [Bacteroidales bacterium]|jgi:hypothetical protein|nr:hypothetical protein [Bacteroidales bacterium]
MEFIKRLKIITASVLVLATSITIHAQDIIVTVKAEKIEAEITEITTDVVRYKQYGYQDSLIYTIKKEDVVSILYQNGQVSIFESSKKNTEYQKVIEQDTTDIEAINYAYFKSLGDDAMADFLEKNDPESYQIFHRGELQSRTGRDLIISGFSVTAFGGLTIASWGLISIGSAFYAIIKLGNVKGNFYHWWWANEHWFPRIALYAVLVGQPLLMTGIVLRATGGTFKRKAKNNYEEKFFKGYTTSLNFNVYPNGFGFTFNF